MVDQGIFAADGVKQVAIVGFAAQGGGDGLFEQRVFQIGAVEAV